MGRHAQCVCLLLCSVLLVGGACRDNEVPSVSYECVDQMLRQMQVETLSCTVSFFSEEDRESPAQTVHWWYSEPGLSRKEVTAKGSLDPFYVVITDHRAMRRLSLQPRHKTAAMLSMTHWPEELAIDEHAPPSGCAA